MGNGAKICRDWAVPGSTFYRRKKAFVEQGIHGSVRRRPVVKSHPRQINILSLILNRYKGGTSIGWRKGCHREIACMSKVCYVKGPSDAGTFALPGFDDTIKNKNSNSLFRTSALACRCFCSPIRPDYGPPLPGSATENLPQNLPQKFHNLCFWLYKGVWKWSNRGDCGRGNSQAKLLLQL